MAENLFKTKSLVEIEICLAKALTDLLGREAKVAISGITTPEGFVIRPAATFTVNATHAGDWDDNDAPF